MRGLYFIIYFLYHTAVMPEHILDLHIHSKYSRACSPDLELPKIAAACAVRGITIAATGDFTHPAWFAHMKEHLVEENKGIYKLRTLPPSSGTPLTAVANSELRTQFIIGTEISSIKKHAGETRRVHHLIFAPSLEAAEKFNRALSDRGINISADGRPIIGMTSHDILSLMLETDERMVMIPAHAWTPWFGIFGSNGGYDALEECFEDLTPHIFAIETGLSSDPLMNWRWSALDNITLISNSDAHSTAKLGREANVMQFNRDEDATYDEIMRVLRAGHRVKSRSNRDHAAGKFLYTIEFYPEEGKYHLDGHRDCGFVCTPAETKRHGGLCPKCKRPLTIGVMNRVDELADRSEDQARHIKRVPYKSMVPLPEILSDVYEVGVAAKRVRSAYAQLVAALGSEFFILLQAELSKIETVSDARVAVAIDRVRRGEVSVRPGYDGIFGVVKVFQDGEGRPGVAQSAFTLD